MKSSKVTLIGLIAATAFIFTSCTKDSDVVPGNRFAAPTAELEQPSINEVSTDRTGNEFEEADYGYSAPQLPTVEPVVTPTPNPTPPILNSVNRGGDPTQADNAPTQSPNPITNPPIFNSVNRGGDPTQADNAPTPTANPITTQPILNSANRGGDASQADNAINEPMISNPFEDINSKAVTYPIMVPYTEPHVLPTNIDGPSPAVNINSARTGSVAGTLPDCTFPVVGKSKLEELDY